MINFINHNSFLLLEITIWIVVGYRLFRGGFEGQNLLLFAGLTVLLFSVYITFRPNQATSSQIAQIQEQIGTGKPVLLELQSPY